VLTIEMTIAINLARRPDRWDDLQRELAATEWPLPRPIRYLAQDGRDLEPPDWWQLKYPHSRCGQYGCFLSHAECIRWAAQFDWDSVLILEDDAFFCPGFRERYYQFAAMVPDDWDLVYFGGNWQDPDCEPPEEIQPGLLRLHGCLTTHAYVVRSTIYSRLTQVLSSPAALQTFPIHTIDRILCAMGRRGDFTSYAPRRWLVGQSGSPSDLLTGCSLAPRYWNAELPSKAEVQ